MNTQSYKEKLLKEKKILLEELSGVGHMSDKAKGEWEATPEVLPPEYDQNSLADKFEDFEERTALKNILEPKLKEVTDALEKIDSGKFGICEVCEGKIETERLDANTSARTCIAHINNN
jgi:RNA polymerase-binding transcription factor DksA